MSTKQQQKPQLTKRAVVSSFIFKFPEDGGKPVVALFKRSDKVSTYQLVIEFHSTAILEADHIVLRADTI